MRNNDRGDAFIAALLLVLVLLVGGGVAFVIYDVAHVDQINHDFTVHCNKLGGHAIITDKDLCVRNGLIVDHEG